MSEDWNLKKAWHNGHYSIFEHNVFETLRQQLIDDIVVWLDDNVNSVSLFKPIVVDDDGTKSDLVTVYGLMDIMRDTINKRFGVDE